MESYSCLHETNMFYPVLFARTLTWKWNLQSLTQIDLCTYEGRGYKVFSYLDR